MADTPRPDDSATRLRAVLKLGVPLVAGMGGHAFFNLVDLAMVGGYESDPVRAELTIAGVTIASLLTTAPLVFINGICTGTVPLIAFHFGAGNFRRANQVGRQALLLAGVFSILLGVIPALFAEEISLAFKAARGLELHVATEYLAITCYHAWTGFLLIQVTSNMRSIGMGMWPMVLLLSSNVGNILGNWLLIYGKLGFPEMGAPGAAWATVIARAVAFGIGIVVLTRAHPSIRLTLGGWRPRWRFMSSVLAKGMPVALQWTARLSAVVLVLFVISGYGPAAKAAYGIGTRLETLALFAGLGWGGACAALVGQALARDQLEGARRVVRYSALLCVVMMSVGGVCYFLFPDTLIRLFSLSVGGAETMAGTVEQGTLYLQISVFAYPAAALAVVFSHALNGAGSVKTPLLIDAVGLLVVQVPLAAVLVTTELGISGAWWALVVSHSLIALVYYLVFRTGAWERKRLR